MLVDNDIQLGKANKRIYAKSRITFHLKSEFYEGFFNPLTQYISKNNFPFLVLANKFLTVHPL